MNLHVLNRLQDHGVLVKFVTNTTKEPLRLLYDRLCRLGYEELLILHLLVKLFSYTTHFFSCLDI